MRWERAEGKSTPGIGREGILGPGKRWGHTCNAVKGGRFLYVFGGYGEDNCQTNDVHVFDTVKLTWSKPLINGVPPSPRDSHTCTTVGNNLFVFGGTDGENPLSDLHVLDTSSNTWLLPDVSGKGPDAREGHSAALVGKKLFIFGGCGKSENNVEIYYDDLFILDTENFIWWRALCSGNSPSARDSHTCAAWRNKLIVLGGEDASDYYLSDVFVLDTDTMVWKELSTSGQMLAPRAGHCSVALGKNLFVFGGFTDHRSLYDDLHVLNMDNGIWNRVCCVNEGPSARFSAAGDCVDAGNGVLVWIGGCNGNLDALDDMYYLYTDIHGRCTDDVDEKPDKFSFKKELKRKCLDVDLNKNGPTLMTGMPLLSPNSLEEKTFHANIVERLPNGYAVETIINGQRLRGVLLSCNVDFDSGRLTLINNNKKMGPYIEPRQKSKMGKITRDGRSVSAAQTLDLLSVGAFQQKPKSETIFMESGPETSLSENLGINNLFVKERSPQKTMSQETVSEGLGNLVSGHML